MLASIGLASIADASIALASIPLASIALTSIADASIALASPPLPVSPDPSRPAPSDTASGGAPSPPHVQGPKLSPSGAQTWKPAHAPGPTQPIDAPGTHAVPPLLFVVLHADDTATAPASRRAAASRNVRCLRFMGTRRESRERERVAHKPTTRRRCPRDRPGSVPDTLALRNTQSFRAAHPGTARAQIG